MTDAQIESLKIIENDILENYTDNDINEMFINDGVRCHYSKQGLEHVVTDREFFFEILDDDSIFISLDEVCDAGYKSTTPLYIIDPDGEIHDL